MGGISPAFLAGTSGPGPGGARTLGRAGEPGAAGSGLPWRQAAKAFVAADRVTVSVDGKDSVIDVTSKKTDVTLVFPFKGLSTVRTGGAVTGVSVDDITVMVKGEEKKGKGTLTLAESDGKITVVKVVVQ